MSNNRVTLLLLTYNRFDYAKQTLMSALDNIMTTKKLAVHIADDGTGYEYTDRLRHIAGGYAHVEGITVTDSRRGGYGRNFNLATQVIHQHSDYVLVLEDDWELMKPLDLDRLIRALDGGIGVECIRLGYMSFTQALYGRVMAPPPHWEKYLLLNPNSDEPHVFAGHPRLETRMYQQRVGPWPEGLAPGDTEFAVAHKKQARIGVAWPMFNDPDNSVFQHIGTIRSTDV